MKTSVLTTAFVALSAVIASNPAVAQSASPIPIVIHPFIGAYIPTAEQRDALKAALLVGSQVTVGVGSQVSLTGAFAWAGSHDKLIPGNEKLDAFQYDLGVELRSPVTDLGWVSPFVGTGVGARVYSYRNYRSDSKTNVDGYGALGFDASLVVLKVRIEGRDYVSHFKPLAGGGSTATRNDVALFGAFSVPF